jgi:hypothetical protein
MKQALCLQKGFKSMPVLVWLYYPTIGSPFPELSLMVGL